MTLKDIGRFSDFIKGIKGIDKTLDKVSQGQAIGDLLRDLSDASDINKVLKHSGVSKDVAKEALKYTAIANSLDDLSDVADKSGNKLKNVDAALDGLTDDQKGLNGLENAFKGLGNVLKSPTTWAIAGLAVASVAIYKYINAFDDAAKKAEQSQSAFISTSNEISSLNSEIETTSARISELESMGSLTITEKSELSNLKLQNAELERQRDLKQEIANQQSDEAVNDAMTALNMTRTSDITNERKVDYNSQAYWTLASVGATHAAKDATYNRTDIITATQNEIDVLNDLIQKREDLLLERQKSSTSKARKSEIDEEIDSLEENINLYKSEVSTNMETLQSLRSNFLDESGNVKADLTSQELAKFNAITNAIDSYTKENPLAKQAEALSEIWKNDSFAIQQQKIVDALRSGSEISVDDITKQFPELVSECDKAGISVETLREELIALASQDSGLTKLESDFAEFQTTAVNAINSMDVVNAALANSYSGKGLSIEFDEETGELSGDIEKIKTAYQDLGGYDAGMLFEKTANGVQLNREALRQLQAQQEAIQKQKFTEKQLELQNKLNDAKKKQSEFEIGSSDYSAYQTEINSLNNQLETVNQLASAYEGATSAYQKWLDAQSNGEAGDMYRNVSEAMEERGKELYKEGRYNSEEFRAIADYFSYEDLSTAPMEKVKQAYEDAGKAREKYFTGDKTGIDNFMYDMEHNAELQAAGIVKTLEDGTMEFQAGADELLAQEFNLSLEAIHALMSAATEYNDKIRVGDTSNAENLAQKLAEATAKAEEAKTKLKELQDTGELSTKLNFDIDVSKLDESGIEEYISNLESLKIEAEAEFGADSSEVEYVNDLLEEANTRKEQLAQSSVVDIEVNGDDLETLGEQLSSIPENTSANVSVTISNDEQLESVVNQIENVPLDSTAHFTFDVQNVDQADILEEKITTLNASRGDNQITYTLNVADNSGTSNNVSVTANVSGQDQVNALKASIDSVKDKSVSVKAATTGIAAVTTLANEISKLRSKTITLTTVKETVSKAEGTLKMPARASGTAYNVLNAIPYSAYANGNISLPRNEKALVNELGIKYAAI